MTFALLQRAITLGGGKCCIYFECIRCNTHAYIRCNTDAYIRCPHMHACIRCLAAAAGNNGDCTVVFELWPLSNNAAGRVVVHTKLLLSLSYCLSTSTYSMDKGSLQLPRFQRSSPYHEGGSLRREGNPLQDFT